jgi:hypothetical protein
MKWKGHLLISTGDEEMVLSIKGSEVRVVDAGETTHVICGGQDIVQLIWGTDTPEDGIELSGDAEPLGKIPSSGAVPDGWESRFVRRV